jgi:hypothetical protein
MTQKAKITIAIFTSVFALMGLFLWVRELKVDNFEKRSSQLNGAIIDQMSKDNASTDLFSLVTSDVGQSVETICFVAPYSRPTNVPQLKDIDLGADGERITPVPENGIGIVTLDASGRVLAVRMIDRSKIELKSFRPSCLSRHDKPIVKNSGRESNGALILETNP